jgi:hypothetical protein
MRVYGMDEKGTSCVWMAAVGGVTGEANSTVITKGSSGMLNSLVLYGLRLNGYSLGYLIGVYIAS